MNDREYEETKARIVALVERWVRATGLGWWKITSAYDRTGGDFAEAIERTGNFQRGSAARCFAEWRYGIATILWNMPLIAEFDDEELEMVVVHELMHVFLNEMASPKPADLAHEERVATSLQKAFMWARDAARDEGSPS